MSQVGERLSPGHRLKRQLALFGPSRLGCAEHLRMRAEAACRVEGCRQPTGPNGLFCSGHYFALPASDARFLNAMQAEARRTADEETRRYLVEQLDGYANQFARQMAGENRA